MDIAFFSVTETWFNSSAETDLEIRDVESSEGIKILAKNRRSRGGGVALLFDTCRANFKIERLKNNLYELLFCVGTVGKMKRKVIVATLYIPPKMTASELTNLGDYIADSIEHLKQRYDDPIFIVTGDLNNRDLAPFLLDFPEIKRAPCPPTRLGSHLDQVFSNIDDSLHDVGVLPPLESNSGLSTSDHGVVVASASLPCAAHFTKNTFTFRPITSKGTANFQRMVATTDWTPMMLDCPSRSADSLNAILQGYVELCFPEKTRTIKSTDQPWFTQNLRQLSRKKKREYRKHRRSARWKHLSAAYERMKLEAKTAFFEKTKEKVAMSNNSRDYFRAIKGFAKPGEATDSWDIRDIFPQKSDQFIADSSAAFFNKISREYSPLLPEDVFGTDDTPPDLHEIAARLRYCKKTKGRVGGDIMPQTVAPLADVIAVPLFHIFSAVYRTGVWPSLWSTETVHLIPKVPRPSDLSQLRNLSCTPLFSKVLEFFVLKRIKAEIQMKPSQFGGIGGSSTDHFLIETWDAILRGLDDNRAACTLASIDFEKAFNRVDHGKFLAAAQSRGASRCTLSLLRAFLTSRTMSVKIGSTMSAPLPVSGGSPQGSLLGNFIFCVATESLADCCREVNAQRQLVGSDDHTPTFSDNGRDASLSPGRVGTLPPIGGASPPPSALATLSVSAHSTSDEDEIRASDFAYFRPIYNRINDTVLSDRFSQSEIDHEVGVPADWVDHDLEIKVYIDDVNVVEKTKMFSAISNISHLKQKLLIHSPLTEKIFEKIEIRAKDIGMVVNKNKTQLLCISAACYSDASTYIRPFSDNATSEISSGPSLKILGFWFDRRPTVSFHISKICEHFRAKLWSLRWMRRSGMGQNDLLFVYQSSLRPIIEYSCVTYGPMLNARMAGDLERLQLRAFKIVFGINVSYSTVLKETSIGSLQDRRKSRLRAFAEKTARNARFASRWFPPAPVTNHDTRHKKKYLEEHALTDRLYKSPLFTMRRLLNE